MNTPARLGAYAAGRGVIFAAGDLTPGRVSKLVFTVSKDGRPVGDLVTTHAGDLAYPHPEEGAGGRATFAASAPGGGDHRLPPDFNRRPAARRERKEW
ncbi:hypothetical protein [Microbispora sp. GKU 823]|uniref:hypothetical protein n=1 Tax=Microbispora sp. GKU 823 TaxID=1652100 RepID=UPI0009A352A5|nr:hypothetical protein [Microbispora sp. GKU 823]OPG02493.1 hypothetical protein B1L11_42325 [Microbispora sp. GKU 823]